MIQVNKKKAIIIAPFWGMDTHVGLKRVTRFVKWLHAANVFVVVVCASKKEYVLEREWGVEIAVRDPFEFYSGSLQSTIKVRKPSKFRQIIAKILFNPDPTVVWAKKLVKDKQVLSNAAGANFVISSSPPESSHVAGALLAKKINAKLIVDMRDGWLDSPLKSWLQKYRLQRWREGRLEKNILTQADKIFISTSGLYTLLTKRLPFVKNKTTLLTNGYSVAKESFLSQDRGNSNAISLLYAGNFTKSSLARKPHYLFEAFYYWIKNSSIKGKIELLTCLLPDDEIEVSEYMKTYAESGWLIDVKNMVNNKELKQLMCNSDGLLLLSVDFIALTGKLFEYLPTGKPILTVTQKDSELWNFAKNNPQMFLVDYENPSEYVSTIDNFINACKERVIFNCLPIEFSEEYLGKLFIKSFLN